MAIMATAMAAATKRKGSMLTEAAAAGTGGNDGDGMAEGVAVAVGRGAGGGVVCSGEETCIEGGTEGTAGEGDCPKLVGV